MAAIDILRCFEETPPPFDYVLPGMLAGSVGFMLSPGGTGKSMWALAASCAIASGAKDADVLGLEPTQGKVMYFSAEDGEIPIWHRLHAMGSRFGPETRAALGANLSIQDIVGMRPDIMDEKWHGAIVKYGKGLRLIVLDTLTRFHQLDENSNGDMAKLVSILEYIAKQTGAAILVIHHSSKSMAINGRGDEQQAARGASALIDNARWAGNLVGMTVDESKMLSDTQGGNVIGPDNRGYYVRFAVSKQNHGKPFPETWYVRSDGGILVKTTLHAVEKRKRGGRDEA